MRLTRRTVGVAAALTLVAGVAAAAVRDEEPEHYPQRVHTVTRPPADAAVGTVYQLYAPDDGRVLDGRPAAETFGVDSLVVTPDRTVWAGQNLRFAEQDNQSLTAGSDLGRALVRIPVDGPATLVDGPYADRRRGRDLRPLCAGPDGSLYGVVYDPVRLVRRDPAGAWHELVRADERPATTSVVPLGQRSTTPTLVSNCAVAADGTLLVGSTCLVHRVDLATGRASVAAGRLDAGNGHLAGCGAVDLASRSPGSRPRPAYGGRADRSELAWVDHLAAGPDGSTWIAAGNQLLRLTSDGRLVVEHFPGEGGDRAIGDVDSAPDGTLYLTSYARRGPVRLLARTPAGRWSEIAQLRRQGMGGAPARPPAPLAAVDMRSPHFAAGPRGWLYFYGTPGIFTVRVR